MSSWFSLLLAAGGGWLLVVIVGVGCVGGLLSFLQVVGISTVVIGSSVNLEARFLVMIVGEDFLQGDDTGDGEGNFADDQSFSSDEGQHFQSQWSGDSHGSQNGSDDVFVLLLLAASLGQVNFEGVRLEELFNVLDEILVDFGQSAEGTCVGEDWRVVNDFRFDEADSINDWNWILIEGKLWLVWKIVWFFS